MLMSNPLLAPSLEVIRDGDLKVLTEMVTCRMSHYRCSQQNLFFSCKIPQLITEKTPLKQVLFLKKMVAYQ